MEGKRRSHQIDHSFPPQTLLPKLEYRRGMREAPPTHIFPRPDPTSGRLGLLSSFSVPQSVERKGRWGQVCPCGNQNSSPL